VHVFVVVSGVQGVHVAVAQQPNVEPSAMNDTKGPFGVVPDWQHGKQSARAAPVSVGRHGVGGVTLAWQHPAPANPTFCCVPEKMHPHDARTGV